MGIGLSGSTTLIGLGLSGRTTLMGIGLNGGTTLTGVWTLRPRVLEVRTQLPEERDMNSLFRDS